MDDGENGDGEVESSVGEVSVMLSSVTGVSGASPSSPSTPNVATTISSNALSLPPPESNAVQNLQSSLEAVTKKEEIEEEDKSQVNQHSLSKERPASPVQTAIIGKCFILHCTYIFNI